MKVRDLSMNDQVRKRARNRCEICGCLPPRNGGSNRRGSIHHRLPRRLGGDNSLSNLILLCIPCHRRVHSAEHLAARTGWLAWSDPEMTPMLHAAAGWVLLVPDGTLEHLCESSRSLHGASICEGCEAEAHLLLAWVNGVQGLSARNFVEGLAQAG